MLEGWIFKYMNGHGPVNATMQAAVEQNLKVHFTMVKGMVCLIQSLLLNVRILTLTTLLDLRATNHDRVHPRAVILTWRILSRSSYIKKRRLHLLIYFRTTVHRLPDYVGCYVTSFIE